MTETQASEIIEILYISIETIALILGFLAGLLTARGL